MQLQEGGGGGVSKSGEIYGHCCAPKSVVEDKGTDALPRADIRMHRVTSRWKHCFGLSKIIGGVNI